MLVVKKIYVLVAVDTFLHWLSAYVCSSNKSKNVLKFLRKYINTHGHPRKLHLDQATGFFSNEIQNFCNYEGIEFIKSPVRDHRATGMVERTIGSIKNYVLTYLQENKNYKFGEMISRALSALRFVSHSKTKLTPFEAYHGREANTALRNLTKKPSLKNLNWNNVVNQKLSCLDKAGNLPEVEHTLDWEKRSDLVYAPQNRKAPIILDDDVVADPKAPEVLDPKELSPPKTATWLKKHKTSSTTVYQRTGKTDPNDPRRYKRLPLKNEKMTKHTLQMEKGSLLRRSGVSFRSAAEESLIGNRSEECTPGPSRNVTSTPAPSESNKYKRKAENDRTAMENVRKSIKQRIVEYSVDESEDDDDDYDSEWEIGRREPTIGAANEEQDVQSVSVNSPRSVGGKRNKNQYETATRKSTQQRRGVDKMGGVMIHRIEHK